MTIKQILELNEKELTKMMTDEQYDRMRALGYERTWKFLDMLKDSARLSSQDENEEYMTISQYLEYLEQIKKYVYSLKRE